MLLDYLRYRFVKARLVAYLNGELPPALRRFVARQIDENPRCRALYEQERRTQQALERDLPRIGQPQATQLDAMWQAIQTELAAPQPAPARQLAPQRLHYAIGFATTALLVGLFMVLPVSFDAGSSALPAPEQHPRPQVMVATAMPATQQVALQPTPMLRSADHVATPDELADDLHNTPAPHTPDQ